MRESALILTPKSPMTAQIIDGKAVAEALRNEVKANVDQRLEKQLRRPGLAVILVGEDPASQVYVRNKKIACEKAGIDSIEFKKNADITEDELLGLIEELNQDQKVDGILVQLPLPAHISEDRVIETISPEKDVDGFHPYNIGCLTIGKPTFRPCTTTGVTRLLESTGIDLTGMDAVIVGRSNIVGRPMMLELLARDCTPRICHSRTKNLSDHVRSADIVVAAIGKPNFIPGDWIKPGAIVIDVGINRLDDGSLAGDVDFETAKETAGYITPVPGGVGPMTIACLLQNTLQSAENRD